MENELAKMSLNGFVEDWKDRLQRQIDSDMARLEAIRQLKSETALTATKPQTKETR